MEIELCGYKVQIDEEDYTKISAWNWHISTSSLKRQNTVYFYHTCKKYAGRQEIVAMHRYIMGCTYKDGVVVDHISGDTLDNRKSNLRRCTRAENNRNQKISWDNTTGYKGVVYEKVYRKYRATITLNKQTIFLGAFNTPEEAYAAYCEASKKYHGEFGRLGTK